GATPAQRAAGPARGGREVRGPARRPLPLRDGADRGLLRRVGGFREAQPPSVLRTLLARPGRGVREARALPPLHARRGRGSAMRNPLSKWAVLAIVSGTVLVSDQVTKYLAVSRLTYLFEAVQARSLGEKLKAFLTQKDLLERGLANSNPAPVIGPVWQHRYTQNRGAAWGFLAGAAEKFRVPFFYAISIAAVIFIF